MKNFILIKNIWRKEKMNILLIAFVIANIQATNLQSFCKKFDAKKLNAICSVVSFTNYLFFRFYKMKTPVLSMWTKGKPL